MSILLLFSTIGAQAGIIDDILNGAVKSQIERGGSRPPRYPGPGRPLEPGRPYEPGRPGYPGQPGQQVTCVAVDRGYEEHGGGHYGCGECLRLHGECIETCSMRSTECQSQGVDRYGRAVSFLGRGDSQWRAEDEAMRACYYYAAQCQIVRCQDRNETVSRQNCRR